MQNKEPTATATLKQIQLRLSVLAGQQLTHSDLADIAGVSVRSIGEWMRGSSTPPGIPALLRLLSSLSQEDVSAVLLPWAALDRPDSNPDLYVKNESTELGKGKLPATPRKQAQHTTTI